MNTVLLRISLLLTLIISISSCEVRKHRGFGGGSVYQPYNEHITIRDTEIITQYRSFDTIISIQSRDTIIIRDEKTRIETRIIKLPGDSFFIEPICPPDTVVVTKVKVETIKERLVESVEKKWHKHIIMAIIAVVGLLAVGYVVNALKK
jgi:hypothetical protein